MSKERLAKLTESFLADYSDRDINARLFFDWWSDRQRLAESAARKVWEAVAVVLQDRRTRAVPRAPHPA